MLIIVLELNSTLVQLKAFLYTNEILVKIHFFIYLPSMKNEHLIQILCRCTFHSNFQYMKIAFKYCKMYFLKRKYEENIRRKTRSWTSVLEHTRYVLADEALWWFLIYVNILFSVCKGSQYNTTDIHSLSFNWNDSSCQRGKREHTSEVK